VAIREKKPIIIPSGHAQGKDWISSSIGLWFLYNYYPSKVIITAPTDRQVKEIMWAEVEKRWNNAKVPLDGRLLTCKVDIEEDWFMLGFTTKETGNMTGKFQGFHSPNIMALVSEAQAVPDQIFQQLDGILTSDNSLLVQIGNPLRTTGTFAKAIKNTTDNIVICLSCLDSPNYMHQQNIIPGMASYDWVEKMRKKYGPEHPIWFGRVLGQLPPTSIDSVFNPDLVDNMVNIHPRIIKRLVTVVCDPARFGDDDIVIYGMVSGRVVKQHIQQQAPADAVCSHILQMVKAIGANQIDVDGDGLGGPIIDFLHKMKPANVRLNELRAGAKAEDEEHYQNAKSEWWMYAKEQAEKGFVSIPDDEYLKEELLETKYFFNNKGKIQIEKKDDIKERIGRSPDRADAWVMGVWGQRRASVVKTSDPWLDNSYDVDSEVSSRVDSPMSA